MAEPIAEPTAETTIAEPIIAEPTTSIAEPIAEPSNSARRYPKRKRTVSFHLEPYILDYNSDEDMDINLDEHIAESSEDISEGSLSDTDELISTESETSIISLMDQSDVERDELTGRDGTLWSESYAGGCEIFPGNHILSLTTVSQKATTMSDKNPGVRPIGICEVARRIISKAILKVIGKDIQGIAGTTQLCAGQTSGIDAAIHSLRKIYEDKESDALLLVDATNAFNQLNRRAALYNIRTLCPIFAQALQNIYGSPAELYTGGEVLYSREGTTDPLAMPMHAIGILPLIRKLKTSQAKQAWYADDANCGGRLQQVRVWWDQINKDGSAYGYMPNPC